MGLLREDSAGLWRREADLEAVTIAITAIIAGVAALAVTPEGGIPWEPLIIGVIIGIARWGFFGYESLEAIRDASEARGDDLPMARSRSSVRGGAYVAVSCALITALSTLVAQHVLRAVLVGFVVFGCFALAEWIAVRRIEWRRGMLVYRRTAANETDYVLCRPIAAMDAFGR